jgi:hypothetical protein
MCRKTIYYNTYGDGSEDVTERVDTCRPGRMCSRPERHEYHRQYRFSKLGVTSPETPASMADRRPTAYTTAADFLELPPTPRSKSPSPSRKHESGVYINGEKVAAIHAPRKEKRRNHVVVHAPEPPSPIRPAAMKRHSTMPSDYVVIENEAGRGRHGRHATTTTRRRSASRGGDASLRVPSDALGSRNSSPSRRSASPRPVRYRDHTRTAEGQGLDYLDAERAERRRSRRSSAYVRRATDDEVYLATPAASPPARKEVHFTPTGSTTGTTGADPVRDSIRRQNERIARRPKLHQEVKGILKKDTAAAAAAAATAAPAVARNEYDALRRAVGQMGIHPPTSSTAVPLQQPRLRSELSDPQYWDRLKSRFEDPRERRRKSRVYYPGEGVYKYM